MTDVVNLLLGKEENPIFSKFLNLKPEKQQRIINVALKEFAQKGFDKASTDEIVKEAGISKGSLFHYFKSKKDMYLFLYDYTLEVLSAEYFSKIDFGEKDILQRLHQIAVVKIELIRKYPEIFNFGVSAYYEESPEVKNKLGQKGRDYIAAIYQKLLGDIDTSRFKDGMDIEKAINIIRWTLDGFANQVAEKTKPFSLDEINYDPIIEEMDVYLDLLRKCLYKE